MFDEGSSVQVELLDELCEAEHGPPLRVRVHGVHGDELLQVVLALAARAADSCVAGGRLQPAAVLLPPDM